MATPQVNRWLMTHVWFLQSITVTVLYRVIIAININTLVIGTISSSIWRGQMRRVFSGIFIYHFYSYSVELMLFFLQLQTNGRALNLRG